MAGGRSGGQRQVWEIVGGQGSGGIVVRTGPELSSEKTPQRLATGATVLEISQLQSATAGLRLNFRRLSGTGPEEGWLSVSLKRKELARKVALPMKQPSKAIIAVEAPSRREEKLTRLEDGVDITGRWTMVSDNTGMMSFFRFEHKAGSSEFTGEQIETGEEIKEGSIKGSTVKWRLLDYAITAKLTEQGRKMEEVQLRHVRTNVFGVDFYTGTWDPGKKKYLVDNTFLNSSSPGLEYRRTPSLPDVERGNFVEWGSVIIGIDEGKGWVKVLDRYLPKFMNGKLVLRDAELNPPKLLRAAGKEINIKLAERTSIKVERDLLSSPEQLFGWLVPGVPRVTHGQVVALQRHLAKGYAEAAFQGSLHAAWREHENSLADQLAAVRQLCGRVQAAALSALAEDGKGTATSEVQQSAVEHTAAMTNNNGSELLCNALLLKYLLEPDLQALVAVPPAHSAEYCEIIELRDFAAFARSFKENATAHEELYLAYHGSKPFYGGTPPEEWIKALGGLEESYERSSSVLVARRNGEVVGCASAGRQDSEMVINHIGVAPKHRGRGVASLLLSRLLEGAPDAVKVDLVEINSRAVAWFRRKGFTVSRLRVHRMISGPYTVPAALLTMSRGAQANAQANALFGPEIIGSSVSIFPPEAPVSFLDAVARHQWHWLGGVEVKGFEKGMHRLQDGRLEDLGRAYSAGRAIFDRPLHHILRKPVKLGL